MRSPRLFTLLEMIITVTVLLILASAVVPMAKNGIRRQKELELRRSLREMRLAIDAYKTMVDQQKIKPPALENNGYPESLEILVEGAPMMGKTTQDALPAPHPRGSLHWARPNGACAPSPTNPTAPAGAAATSSTSTAWPRARA